VVWSIKAAKQRADDLCISPLMAQAREALREHTYQSAFEDGSKLSPELAPGEARAALEAGN